MVNIHNQAGREELYMILRVFGLEHSRIGMCVYLDPEKLRADGTLRFTGETWSIVPRNVSK